MHSVALAWDKSEQMKAYISFLNCADSLKDIQNAQAVAKVHYHYILHCKRAKANQSFSATADWAPLSPVFFFFSCRFCYWNVQFALVLYTVIGRTSRKFSKLSFYIPFHLHGGSIVPLTSKTLYFVIGSQLGFHSTLCLPPRDLACCFLSSKWADPRDAVIVNWGALSDCNQRLILGGLILAPVHDMGSREGFKVV